MTQPTPQPTPTTNPPTCGQLALEIDNLWEQTRSPKIGLFAMRRIYARLAELRAQLAALEKTPDD